LSHFKYSTTNGGAIVGLQQKIVLRDVEPSTNAINVLWIVQEAKVNPPIQIERAGATASARYLIRPGCFESR